MKCDDCGQPMVAWPGVEDLKESGIRYCRACLRRLAEKLDAEMSDNQLLRRIASMMRVMADLNINGKAACLLLEDGRSSRKVDIGSLSIESGRPEGVDTDDAYGLLQRTHAALETACVALACLDQVLGRHGLLDLEFFIDDDKGKDMAVKLSTPINAALAEAFPLNKLAGSDGGRPRQWAAFDALSRIARR